MFQTLANTSLQLTFFFIRTRLQQCQELMVLAWLPISLNAYTFGLAWLVFGSYTSCSATRSGEREEPWFCLIQCHLRRFLRFVTFTILCCWFCQQLSQQRTHLPCIQLQEVQRWAMMLLVSQYTAHSSILLFLWYSAGPAILLYLLHFSPTLPSRRKVRQTYSRPALSMDLIPNDLKHHGFYTYSRRTHRGPLGCDQR